jgi:hypothetical protein
MMSVARPTTRRFRRPRPESRKASVPVSLRDERIPLPSGVRKFGNGHFSRQEVARDAVAADDVQLDPVRPSSPPSGGAERKARRRSLSRPATSRPASRSACAPRRGG